MDYSSLGHACQLPAQAQPRAFTSGWPDTAIRIAVFTPAASATYQLQQPQLVPQIIYNALPTSTLIIKHEGEVLLIIRQLLYVALLKSVFYFCANNKSYSDRKNRDIFKKIKCNISAYYALISDMHIG